MISEQQYHLLVGEGTPPPIRILPSNIARKMLSYGFAKVIVFLAT